MLQTEVEVMPFVQINLFGIYIQPTHKVKWTYVKTVTYSPPTGYIQFLLRLSEVVKAYYEI